MTDSIAGSPFWEIEFDVQGDPDPDRRATFVAEVPHRGVTDLFVFAHGWNNDPVTARRLYDGFFGLLAQQHAAHPGPATIGLAGVVWPAQRWSDEPIPDFTPTGPVLGGDGGAAAAVLADTGAPVTVAATLDAATLTQLTHLFPEAADDLTRMAALLAGPVTDDALAEFHTRLTAFTDRAGTADDDGESAAGKPAQRPDMLADDPATLFGRFRDALSATGADLGGADLGGGGTASLGDVLGRLWNGAKEALRTATYWEMKNRAGTIGRVGLGPLLGALAAAAPGLKIHLIGHSFGARLVSYTLAGLPAGASPVASLTLLEGAFSHFAFVPRMPFDPSRAGALAGMRSRVAGPLTVCFSSHDGAVGQFYPLASLAAGDDSAGAHNPLWRWGGMGADGAQNEDAELVGVQPSGSAYSFPADAILNVDASDVVTKGGPPSGAHSDIVHEELAWIVLTAAGLA